MVGEKETGDKKMFEIRTNEPLRQGYGDHASTFFSDLDLDLLGPGFYSRLLCVNQNCLARINIVCITEITDSTLRWYSQKYSKARIPDQDLLVEVMFVRCIVTGSTVMHPRLPLARRQHHHHHHHHRLES